MPVAIKNDDDIEDDNSDVQFLFVRSVPDEVVAPPPKKQARFNPSHVLVAAHNVIYPRDTTTQEGCVGVLLPWTTCHAKSTSPYLLDLLEALRTTQAFGPLWTKHEANLISVFLGLSMASQDFFVRLCYRKLLWHRLLGVVDLARRVVIDQATTTTTDCKPNSFDFDLENEVEDYIADLRKVEGIPDDDETLLEDGCQPVHAEGSPNNEANIVGQLLHILRELVESGLVHLFPTSISGRKEKALMLEALRLIPRKDLDKVCKALKPRGLRVTSTSTKASRLKQLISFAQRNTIDNSFNPMRELRDAVAEQLLEGTNVQDTEFSVFKLNEEFKYLLRRIMRLADLPAWSSAASTGSYISILSPFFSRGLLVRVGRCLPPPVVAMASNKSNSNVGRGIESSSSHVFFPSRTAFLQMEAAHEAAACQEELFDLPMAEAMQRARHVACRMESLGVCTLQCLPDGKLWNKDSLYTVGAELCWAALQSWYSPGEEEQFFLMAEKTTSPEFFANILNKRLVEKRQDVRDHPIPFSHQFQSGTTLSTGLWNGIQIFEKEKCYVRAVLALVQLLEVGFTPHRRAKYWDRLRIDLIHLSRLHKIDELANLVDKVLLVALSDPAVEAGFRMKLERSLRRGGGGSLPFQQPPPLLPEFIDDPHVNGLHRALVECDYMMKSCGDSSLNGYWLPAKCLNRNEARNKSGRIIYVGEDGEGVNVEELVLQAFHHGGLERCLPGGELLDECNSVDNLEWCGIHDEGRIMGCLIPLLLWDALFQDLPGAFISPYQDAPLDLDCAYHSFYLRRKGLMRKILDKICNSSPIDLCRHIGKTSILAGTNYRQMQIWVKQKSSLGVRWMSTCRNTKSQGGRMIPGPFPWGVRLLQLVAMGLGGKRFSSGQPDLLLLRIRRCKGDIGKGFQTLNPSNLLLKGITLRKNDNDKPWLLPTQPELWATEEADMSPCMMPLEDEDVEELDVETIFIEVKSENDSLSAKQRAWQVVLRAAMGKNRAMVIKVKPPPPIKSSSSSSR